MQREAVRKNVEKSQPGAVIVVERTFSDVFAQMDWQRSIGPDVTKEMLAQPRWIHRSGLLKARHAGRCKRQRRLLAHAYRFGAWQQRQAPARRALCNCFETAHQRKVIERPGLTRQRLQVRVNARLHITGRVPHNGLQRMISPLPVTVSTVSTK